MARCWTLLLAVCVSGCDQDATGPTPEPDPPAPTHPTGFLDATITLLGRPHGVAVADDGSFAVSLIDANRIAYGTVDAITQAVTGDVVVGQAPAHVALSRDASRAFVANQYGNNLAIVDMASYQVAALVPLGGPAFNVIARPGASQVYVTTGSGDLHRVDLVTNSIATTWFVGAAANGLAIDTARHHLYVSSRDANQVVAIDMTTEQVLRVYPVGGQPQRIAITRDGSTLLVATEDVGLEVVDVASGNRTAVANVGPTTVGLALSPDDAQVWVTNPPIGTVQVVDLATRQVAWTRSGLGRPRNIAFAAGGRVAIVTNEQNRLYFFR